MSKKIMFSDALGLTQAVIEGRKTMTRRVVKQNLIDFYNHKETKIYTGGLPHFLYEKSHYKIGEIVAVAQSYETLANSGYLGMMTVPADNAVGFEFKLEYCGGGYNNKMFVRADLMPHQICITDIKVERLQDISDEDCLKEGIYCDMFDDSGILSQGYVMTKDDGRLHPISYYEIFESPRDAFAALIDKVSGKGTWEKNPYCFCYEFELVK